MPRPAIRRALATVFRSMADPTWPPPPPVRRSTRCSNASPAASPFVCPTDWGTAGEEHWWVLSRCGECNVWCEIGITDAQAARLDCVLDRQLNAIHRAAAQLEGERMAAEADAFIDALHRDLIDAADFA